MEGVAELLLRRCPPTSLISYFEGGDGMLVPYRQETRLYDTLVNDVKPVNADYFKRVLKEFTDMLDRTAGDLPETTYESWEWVYEEYVTTLGVALSAEEIETDIIMYRFNENCKVNIAEKPRIIGQGSTGNRTWEASVYLVHYLLENPEVVGDARKVIELGAGTGLVSLAYQQRFPFEELLVTDGDEDIARRKLPQNFSLNEIKGGVSIKRLEWGREQEQLPHGSATRSKTPRANPENENENEKDNEKDSPGGTIKSAASGEPTREPTRDTTGAGSMEEPIEEPFDLILGSDLTYDDRILEPLSTALSHLLLPGGRNRAVVAATVRNPATTKTFEDTLREHGLVYQVESVRESTMAACEETLFKPLVAPIAIYKISK
ncbi:hypothetical protein RNJ44_00556 [Nakaseomyces bracarensis]|uniref:Uncharacterized protein n=1 Tax=Nakaseomyces bracarensis TaxID=273131 RepID=A0ABR4NSY6_9SACH